MSSKIATVKAYVKENKKVIVVGAVCFVAGVAVAPKAIQIMIKSPGSVQTIALARRMHPGFRIVCEETGVELASVNQMAKLLGLPARKIAEQARGLLSDVDGFHFRILGEM